MTSLLVTWNRSMYYAILRNSAGCATVYMLPLLLVFLFQSMSLHELHTVRPTMIGLVVDVTLGKAVLEQGYCILAEAFKLASPGVKYTAEHARRKFLQMPLISIRIGDPSRGQSFSILMETFAGMDYSKVGLILNGLSLQQSSTTGVTLE